MGGAVLKSTAISFRSFVVAAESVGGRSNTGAATSSGFFSEAALAMTCGSTKGFSIPGIGFKSMFW